MGHILTSGCYLSDIQKCFHTKNTDIAIVFRKWVGSDFCNGVSHCGGGPSGRDQQGRSDNETQRRQIINWSNYLELLASFSPGYYMLCRLKPLVSLLPSRRHVPHGLSLWSSLHVKLWSSLKSSPVSKATFGIFSVLDRFRSDRPGLSSGVLPTYEQFTMNKPQPANNPFWQAGLCLYQRHEV